MLQPTDILTPQELAARLKVKKSWVYEQMRSRRNEFPVIRLGRYLRFNWPDVSDWLESKMQPARKKTLGR